MDNESRQSSGGDVANTIILKIESGIVSDIYASAPVEVIIVDHDVIEGGESFEQRMHKSVSTMLPDNVVAPEGVNALVASLVLECKRPADRKSLSVEATVGAAA